MKVVVETSSWHWLSLGSKTMTTYHHAPFTVTVSPLSRRLVLPAYQQSATVNKVCTFFTAKKCYEQVIALMIKGHCSIPENEAAHQAAQRTARENKPISNTTVSSQPVTFGSIKHLINSAVLDCLPQHACTAAVYSRETCHQDISHLPRQDQVLTGSASEWLLLETCCI